MCTHHRRMLPQLPCLVPAILPPHRSPSASHIHTTSRKNNKRAACPLESLPYQWCCTVNGTMLQPRLAHTEHVSIQSHRLVVLRCIPILSVFRWEKHDVATHQPFSSFLTRPHSVVQFGVFHFATKCHDHFHQPLQRFTRNLCTLYPFLQSYSTVVLNFRDK